MAAAQPMPIRMVAGLGNPGEEYANTRHNAGFKTVDELARRAGVSYWKNQLGAEVATTKVRDTEAEGGVREVVLVKPQSFMNTSGGPISKLCREYGIKPQEVLVVHDELDIPEGDVRVKVGGGHAGHNGLRSIIDKLGSRDFSRIRTGIGEPPAACPRPILCSSNCAARTLRPSMALSCAQRTPASSRSRKASSMPGTT